MFCLHKVNGVSIIPFFTKISLAVECQDLFFLIFLSPACLVEMKCKRLTSDDSSCLFRNESFFSTGSKPEYGLQVCKVIVL